MKRKTIRQWLWCIKNENIRDIALAHYTHYLQLNGRSELQEMKYMTFASAMSGAFTWGTTNQGHEYWANLSRDQEVYEDKQ